MEFTGVIAHVVDFGTRHDQSPYLSSVILRVATWSSPNNRGAFPDSCPEQIFDSFIGGKNFSNACPGDPLA